MNDLLRIVNYDFGMPLVDSADLIDSADVAQIVGLTNRNAVAVYRARYSDFPRPVIERGRCVLWLRAEVAAWAATRTITGHEKDTGH